VHGQHGATAVLARGTCKRGETAIGGAAGSSGGGGRLASGRGLRAKGGAVVSWNRARRSRRCGREGLDGGSPMATECGSRWASGRGSGGGEALGFGPGRGRGGLNGEGKASGQARRGEEPGGPR
jgi:hypothetical protein